MLDEIGSVWYRRPTPLHADDHLPVMQQVFIEREARAGLWGMLRAIDGVQATAALNGASIRAANSTNVNYK
jgi:hypothetical protein